MYADLCVYEEFLREKEQVYFLQILGAKGENDERICEDEEITVENLGQNNKNPFITGRKKKEKMMKKKYVLNQLYNLKHFMKIKIIY